MDQDINQKPLVSVILCTYNRADFIMEALESINTQDYPNMEVIVIDDASTDDTSDIIQSFKSKFPIRYFKNEHNLKIARSRQSGLLESRGVYIAILDSDDCWISPNKISAQVEFLKSNTEYALIGTNAQVIDENDQLIGQIENKESNADIHNEILVQNQFVHSTVLYRKSMIQKIGGFTFAHGFEDYDLILKLGRKYKLANLPILGAAYRKHSGSVSSKMNMVKKLFYFVLIIKNFPFYPNRISSIKRRLSL